MKNTLITALALITAAHAGTVPTPEPQLHSDWWNGETMTGDWGGLRTRLHENGVDFFAYYNAIISSNPIGGISSANAYAHDIYYGFQFDLDKLVNWHGATFNLTGVWRDGQDISPEIGSQYSVMQLVGGQEAFLFQINLEQKFFDDKFAFKIGRMTAGDDFATSPLYGNYLNNGIDGNLRAALFDTRFSAYPFPVWGTRLRFDPTKEWNAQLGIYQVSDEMFDQTRHGTDFSIRGDDGFLLLAQVGYTPELWKRPVAPVQEAFSKDGKSVSEVPEMKGYPGHYFVGAWYSSWKYPQFGESDTTPNSYGFYVHGDQMVYQESPGSSQGLTIFSTVVYAPQENIAIVPFQVSGGAIYTGLIPGRNDDRSIFGFIYGNFSDDYSRSVSVPTRPDVEREIVLEAGYRVQVNKWAYIQPDVQFVSTPGGRSDVENALVVGAQFGVKF